MARQKLIPGPEHPITVAPTDEHVVVRLGDAVVADTTSALKLREASYPPVYYVPLADVDRSMLVASETETYCPFKGDASYWSVRTPGATAEDAVWTYEQPYDAVAEIAGHVAFYPTRVEVDVQPGRRAA